MEDSEDPNADVQYHIEVGEDDVANAVLLPGNPERVEKITPVLGFRGREGVPPRIPNRDGGLRRNAHQRHVDRYR